MFYDVRISIGMMFTLIGTILTAFGLGSRSHPAFYAKSLGINVNLWWGLVLVVFGVAVLMLGRRGQMEMENSMKKRNKK
jgi:flagellar biosynthesis protein FliR